MNQHQRPPRIIRLHADDNVVVAVDAIHAGADIRGVVASERVPRGHKMASVRIEAGELLGMSERQFRRYRDRYEEGGLEGLIDKRLGKPSPKRVPETDRR